ncbi:transporter substrate-binding protein [Mesorhizobium sp. NBSH29]|uniref:transporter substrate-binding protein n=1 Tax=Mesorhizobium sp. NBSH29 TaxID=2654249 RepID=UPI0018969648|nr:transporter substrate-binding protein [Mesorhizobium sp. NBSH29]QPC88760.1 transporter substrate-binding protein [Mesorhizobium sp. NBSH29]
MKQKIEVGVLYSRSGSYQLVSDSCLSGAMRAIADINADPSHPLELAVVARDPQSNADRYGEMCAQIFRTSTARHIFGCVTSWSRKETIPVLEKAGGMLWYACPYEGYEANEHVVYMHACPNQHLVPLLVHVAPQFGANGFLLGSNYIWGWETNRVARDLIADAGGQVLGERYLRIGDTDVSRLIEEIRATRPSFILNNLIGTSSYAFLSAYRDLSNEDPAFRPKRCPVLSCNLTECELPAIGAAGNGHLSVGPYFAPRPAAFGSSFEASAYASVQVMADVLSRDPEAGPAEFSKAFASRRFATGLGPITIDPRTQHATLPVVIGRIADGAFDVVSRMEEVEPDPYLSRYDRAAVFGRPKLKVVS